MKLGNRIFFLVLAAAAMLGWSGCGGGCSTTSIGSNGASGGSSSAGTSTDGTVCGPGTKPGGGGNTASLLYFVDNASSRILGASLSTTRKFAALTVAPAVLPSSAGNDMVVVNKKFLYLPQSDTLTIQAFSIDHGSGTLTAISGSPFASAGADSITSDPVGRFLFAGNRTTGQIAVFQINATTGALVQAPGSPFAAFNLDFATVLAVDGTGKFLYVGQNIPALPIYGFAIDQTSGALTPLASSPLGLGVAGVRTDFTGKFAVGLTGISGDNHLYVFSINATTGQLTPVANSPFLTSASTPLDLRIHPSSQFVYSFGTTGSGAFSAVEGFAIDASSGALTALAGSPFTSLPLVADCKWDQGGGEAFCANGTVSSFSILDTNPSTGILTHTVQDLGVSDNTGPFVPTD
jgi:6-phosphogluconolactonase (cycloisomerase 2 family)